LSAEDVTWCGGDGRTKTRRYGASPRAFVVVPMVGAVLIDFTNALIITATFNLLK
jgi:ESS family glutamate:Na+ symporter